jgi:hypothetical protein
MIITIKTKVLIKFGTSEIMCVELRAKKLSNVYRSPQVKYSYILLITMCTRTHAEITNTYVYCLHHPRF